MHPIVKAVKVGLAGVGEGSGSGRCWVRVEANSSSSRNNHEDRVHGARQAACALAQFQIPQASQLAHTHAQAVCHASPLPGCVICLPRMISAAVQHGIEQPRTRALASFLTKTSQSPNEAKFMRARLKHSVPNPENRLISQNFGSLRSPNASGGRAGRWPVQASAPWAARISP